MNTHKTRGIVLKTVHYGDTSIIATVYTELFGIQSYIIKGIRKSAKNKASRANYFQPAAILDMIVYHNEFKHIQFIKEFEWSYMYQQVFFDVVKNAVAMYMIELLSFVLKQPEAHAELYYLAEDSLKQLDKGNEKFTANLPLYFTLHLTSESGFRLHGNYSKETPVLDLKEGGFTATIPQHPLYLTDELAALTSRIANIPFYSELETIPLNRNTRRTLLEAYQQFMRLHITDMAELKSWKILQEVL